MQSWRLANLRPHSMSAPRSSRSIVCRLYPWRVIAQASFHMAMERSPVGLCGEGSGPRRRMKAAKPYRGPVVEVVPVSALRGRSGGLHRAVTASQSAGVVRDSIASGTNWVTGTMLMVASGFVTSL